MKRYTVVVIDHRNGDRARIYKVDNVTNLPNGEQVIEEVVTPFHKIKRVVPNYESVASLLSPDEESKKGGTLSSLRKKRDSEAKKPKKRRTPQELFQEKLDNEQYDEFNANDLCCFFRHTAQKKNINTIINWQKDAAHMKRLQENLPNKDIIAMIEFLFLSKQNYLPKRNLSIGIFTTNWLNTIYQDTQDWLENKYSPSKGKKTKQREWDEDKPDKGLSTEVGWGED